MVFAKDGSLEDRGLVKPDRNNFAPRVGLVYKLNEQTVLRGGYGIFYNLFDRVGSEDQLALNPPGLINNSLPTQLGHGAALPAAERVPGRRSSHPLNLDPAAGDLRRAAHPRRHQRRAQDDDAAGEHRPAARARPQRRALRGRHLDQGHEPGHAGEPQPAAAQRGRQRLGPLPYPNFGFIEWRAQNGRSEYKGIDFGLEKRFSDGYGVRRRLHAGRLEGQHLRAPDHPGLELVPAERARFRAPGTGRATTTSAIAWPSTSWPSCRSARARSARSRRRRRDPRRLDALGHLRRCARAVRSRSTRAATTSGQNMTGLPNLVGDPDGPETVDQWFNAGGVPGRALRAPSATSRATSCAGRAGRAST